MVALCMNISVCIAIIPKKISMFVQAKDHLIYNIKLCVSALILIMITMLVAIMAIRLIRTNRFLKATTFSWPAVYQNDP